MDKPDVDHIDGPSPAISIDQKTTSRNLALDGGDLVTEVYDYLRLLYARVGQPHCPICGRPITGQSVEQIADQVLALPEGTRFLALALVRDRKRGAPRRARADPPRASRAWRSTARSTRLREAPASTATAPTRSRRWSTG